jgi:hypothetical protein
MVDWVAYDTVAICNAKQSAQRRPSFERTVRH